MTHISPQALLLIGLLLYCLASVLSLSHLQSLSVFSSVLSAFLNPVREALSPVAVFLTNNLRSPDTRMQLLFTETLVLILILNEHNGTTPVPEDDFCWDFFEMY